MKKHIMSLSESSKLVILITYNYSRSLYLEKRYRDAIEIANQGLEVSIQSRYAGYIGGLLSVLGHAFYEEGMMEDSKKYFYQSYYMYTIMQDEDNVELEAKNLKDFFDIEVWN